MAKYDVIVVGLGAMGSAALAELARRGARVLGIEQFAIGHDHGSSHGGTRMIRLGYFEHPSYVPLLHRTYELWHELEARSGRKLMHITGIAEIGPPDSQLVMGTLAASKLHNLPHQVMDAVETMWRFPAFKVPLDYTGVFQPDGGFLAVEPAMTAIAGLAQAADAEVCTSVAVESVTTHGDGVRVRTDHGNFDAHTAIVAAGPWLKRLVPNLPAPVRVTRQVQAWFNPLDPALFKPEKFPVFILETPHGQHYGFPASDGMVKIGKHHHENETTDPDRVRAASATDEALIRAALVGHLPAANGPLVTMNTCLYTVTPDHDFIIDQAPGASRIIIASPCSGHGFKFAPVMGEILADLATKGATDHDISRFRLSRFG